MTFGNYIGSILDRFEIKVEKQNLEWMRETKYPGIIIYQHSLWDNELNK